MRSLRLTLPTLALTLFATAACGGKNKPPSDVPPLAKDEPAAGSAAPVATAPQPPASTGPKASDLSDAEFDALMNEVITFFTALGDGVAAATKDCKKVTAKGTDKKAPPVVTLECAPAQCKQMATNLRETLGKHEALLARTKSFSDDETAAQRATTWMQSHQTQVQPIFVKMAEGLKPCAADPEVNEAVKALGESGAAG